MEGNGTNAMAIIEDVKSKIAKRSDNIDCRT
jgi:hypothetical protein